MLYVMLFFVGAIFGLWYVKSNGAYKIVDSPDFWSLFYTVLVVICGLGALSVYLLFSHSGLAPFVVSVTSFLTGAFVLSGKMLSLAEPPASPKAEVATPPAPVQPPKSSVEERLAELLDKNRR